MKHKCKRIRRGNYEYRGYIIQCVGYYHPEHRVCWEACPKDEIYADFTDFPCGRLRWLLIVIQTNKKIQKQFKEEWRECPFCGIKKKLNYEIN